MLITKYFEHKKIRQKKIEILSLFVLSIFKDNKANDVTAH